MPITNTPKMMLVERAGERAIYVFDKSDTCAVDRLRDLFGLTLGSVESVIQDLEARNATSDLPPAAWASGVRSRLLGSIGRSLGFADLQGLIAR
jgi:hypothetical protein